MRVQNEAIAQLLIVLDTVMTQSGLTLGQQGQVSLDVIKGLVQLVGG